MTYHFVDKIACQFYIGDIGSSYLTLCCDNLLWYFMLNNALLWHLQVGSGSLRSHEFMFWNNVNTFLFEINVQLENVVNVFLVNVIIEQFTCTLSECC